MKKNKFLITYFTAVLLLSISFAGCVKHDDYYSVNTGSEPNRKQVVQLQALPSSGIIAIARNVNPTIDTFTLITITRYPNSNADLNQPLTVKLVKNSGAITSFNTANGTNYVEVPSNSYTLLNDITSVTFQPGESIKEIKIRLDKSSLNLSTQYALAYSLSDAGTGAMINKDLQDNIFSIGVKNQYDGHYQVTGTMVDAANAGLTGNYPMDAFLITAGPNSVYLYDNAIGGVYHSILNGGSLSYYGSFGIQINFDPSGNGKVVSVVNVYGQPAGNTRSAQLDPSGANQWDPATKNMDIKYFMLQPSVVPAPPNIRTSFNEHFKYLGPR